MLTFELPVFVSVAFCDSATPTVPFPKFSDETFGESCADAATTVALVPTVTPMDAPEPGLLAAILMTPEALPLVFDMNPAEKLAL